MWQFADFGSQEVPYVEIRTGFSAATDEIGTWRGETLINNIVIDATEFEVTAEGAPEIGVTDDAGGHVLDGRTAAFDFGTATDTDIEKTFTVTNNGGQDLQIGDIFTPIGFTIVDDLAGVVLAPGESDTLTVALEGGAGSILGNHRGEIRIFSNDSDEALYNFAVEGYIEGTIWIASTLASLSGTRMKERI